MAVLAAAGYVLYSSRQGDAGSQQTADLQTRLRDTTTAPQAPADARALLERIRNLQNDPHYPEIVRAQRRRSLPSLYPNLGRWLELTTGQESALFDLIASQEQERMALGVKGFDPAVSATLEAALAAMLGDKYPLLLQYQQTASVHRQISQLQTRLAAGADRLGDAQAMSLTTALVAEQLRLNRRREPFKPSMNPREYMQLQQERAREHEQLLEIAATELKPRQLESYRALLRDEEERSTALYRNFDFADAASPATDR